MKIRVAFIALAGLTIAACATNYATKQPAEIAQAVIKKDSEFDAQITFVGPRLQTTKSRGIFTDYQYAQLRSFKDKKTGRITHQAYVEINYTGSWRYYQSASFKNGTQAEVAVIGRNVDSCTGVGCIYTETLGVEVSEGMLKQVGGALEFRLNAKSGHENIISIPANYLAGYTSVAE